MATNAQKQRDNSKKVVGKPFPKGKSGNPGGRPKGSLNWESLLGLAGIGNNDEVARIKALYAIAKDKKHPGCIKANEILNERSFGKVTQPLSNADGEPLTVRVVYDRKAKHATD